MRTRGVWIHVWLQLAALSAPGIGFAQDSLYVRRVGQVQVAPLGSHTTNLAIQGNYAYATVDVAGVRIVSISDPTNPTVVDSVTTPGPAYDVVVGFFQFNGATLSRAQHRVVPR